MREGCIHRQILFWSTPSSADEGRFTVLAFLETLAAMFLAGFFIWKTGNLLHTAIPAAAAPLLLLRTPESTELGFVLYNRTVRWVEAVDAWQERDRANRLIKESCLYLGFVFFLVVIPSISVVIRIMAIVVTLVRHPITIVLAIPGNWRRIAMAIDLHHPPEMIPGIETASVDKRYRFSEHLHRALMAARAEYSRQSSFFKVVYTSAYFLQLSFLFVPTLSYRWSLKSTTLVWAPLVWVVSTSRKGDYTPAERLDMIITAQTERFRRWYSRFVLIRTVLPSSPLRLFNQ